MGSRLAVAPVMITPGDEGRKPRLGRLCPSSPAAKSFSVAFSWPLPLFPGLTMAKASYLPPGCHTTPLSGRAAFLPWPSCPSLTMSL